MHKSIGRITFLVLPFFGAKIQMFATIAREGIKIWMRHFLWIWLLMVSQAKWYDFVAIYRVEFSKNVNTTSQCFKIIKKVSFWFLIFAALYCCKHLNFRAKKWQHQKCDSTNRFAHPLALICDMNQESALKTLPCT